MTRRPWEATPLPKQVVVWRYQDENGVGPYSRDEYCWGKFEPSAARRTWDRDFRDDLRYSHSNPEHPSPIADYLPLTSQHRCGFSTREDAAAWFERHWVKKMEAHGFRLVPVRAQRGSVHLGAGRVQVTFIPDGGLTPVENPDRVSL